MSSYEKGIFVVMLRDGTSFKIVSDDWRRDAEEKAFRFFDVDETPEGSKNHEVAWLSEADVVGIAEADRISRRRRPAITSEKGEDRARRRSGTRPGQEGG